MMFITGPAKVDDMVTQFWLQVMNMSSARAIFFLSECNQFLHQVSEIAKKQGIFTKRIKRCAQRMFGYDESFWKLMQDNRVLMSGSFVLYAISGEENHWTPNDVDLFRNNDENIGMDVYLYDLAVAAESREGYNELMQFIVDSYIVEKIRDPVVHKPLLLPSIVTYFNNNDGPSIPTYKVQMIIIEHNYRLKKEDEKDPQYEEIKNESVVENIKRTFDLDMVKNICNGQTSQIFCRRSIRDRECVYPLHDREIGNLNRKRVQKFRQRGFIVHLDE